ncbi:MAG TPA: hypothetical protein VNJ02_06700 [Vicinamibacterales bacterium]|nr:hypothetical protein [Vicinamibacterales bacterium]
MSYAYGDRMAHMGSSPEVLARHLAWVRQDLDTLLEPALSAKGVKRRPKRRRR